MPKNEVASGYKITEQPPPPTFHTITMCHERILWRLCFHTNRLSAYTCICDKSSIRLFYIHHLLYISIIYVKVILIFYKSFRLIFSLYTLSIMCRSTFYYYCVTSIFIYLFFLTNSVIVILLTGKTVKFQIENYIQLKYRSYKKWLQKFNKF